MSHPDGQRKSWANPNRKPGGFSLEVGVSLMAGGYERFPRPANRFALAITDAAGQRLITANPTIVFGYSDITALSCSIRANTGHLTSPRSRNSQDSKRSEAC